MFFPLICRMMTYLSHTLHDVCCRITYNARRCLLNIPLSRLFGIEAIEIVYAPNLDKRPTRTFTHVGLFLRRNRGTADNRTSANRLRTTQRRNIRLDIDCRPIIVVHGARRSSTHQNIINSCGFGNTVAESRTRTRCLC